MQASWIDSDELRALAASLQEPVEEIHEEVWTPEPLLDDTVTPEVSPALSTLTASVPHTVVTTPVSEPVAELQMLSARLRAIKEEAQAAGLLPVIQEEPAPVIEEPVAVVEAPLYPQEAPIPQELKVIDEPVMTPEPSMFVAPITPEPVFTQSSELTDMSRRLQSFHQYATELTGCKDLAILNQEGDLLWGNTQHHDVMATIMMAMRYHNPAIFEITHFKLTNLDDTLVVLSTPTRHGQVFLALINAANAEDHHLQKLNPILVAAIEGTPVY